MCTSCAKQMLKRVDHISPMQVNLFTIKPLFIKGFSENKKLVCILLQGLHMCDINYFLIIKDIFEVKSER